MDKSLTRKTTRWAYLKNIPGSIPKPGKLKTSKLKPYGPKESEIQAQVEEYLDARGMFYLRLPDALFMYIYGISNCPHWIKALISKYLKGFPDLIILKGKYPKLECLPLELKSATGKLSSDQAFFQDRIGTVVARSTDEAIELIKEFNP